MPDRLSLFCERQEEVAIFVVEASDFNMSQGKSCLIIGAGMAGLTAAGVLSQAGWEVVLLDKGRSAGGRRDTDAFCAA